MYPGSVRHGSSVRESAIRQESARLWASSGSQVTHECKKPAEAGMGAKRHVMEAQPPWNFIISGTISSATMLMILISGLMAGPAVSL